MLPNEFIMLSCTRHCTLSPRDALLRRQAHVDPRAEDAVRAQRCRRDSAPGYRRGRACRGPGERQDGGGPRHGADDDVRHQDVDDAQDVGVGDGGERCGHVRDAR